MPAPATADTSMEESITFRVDESGTEWVRAERDGGRTVIDRPVGPEDRNPTPPPGHLPRHRTATSAIPEAYARWVEAGRP